MSSPRRHAVDPQIAPLVRIHCGWISVILASAGIYNLVWGTSVVLFPSAWFQSLGIELMTGDIPTSQSAPLTIALWQCVGMVVGVYGLSYLIAATDPRRHWPILLVGLLGKTLGPIGFLRAAATGDMPWSFGWIILCNDVMWWLPFAASLWMVACRSRLPLRVGLPSAAPGQVSG